MPISDGHSLCIGCLGELHIPQKCTHCSNLKTKTRWNQDLHLKFILMEKSLCLASDPGQQTPSPGRSLGTSTSAKDKAHSSKNLRKRATTSPQREPTKKKWFPARFLSSVPTTPRVCTFKAPGPLSSPIVKIRSLEACLNLPPPLKHQQHQ